MDIVFNALYLLHTHTYIYKYKMWPFILTDDGDFAHFVCYKDLPFNIQLLIADSCVYDGYNVAKSLLNFKKCSKIIWGYIQQINQRNKNETEIVSYVWFKESECG
eukprot:362800_1